MSKLFMVGTPIGNPEDMSVRSLNYIKEAKNIVAENPEDFKRFLESLNIDKTGANIMYAHTWPDHIGEEPLIRNVLDLLTSGEDVYVICDAGMPGIADPGGAIAQECIKRGIQIISTPGPSVIIASAVSAGISNAFLFGGFLPKEKGMRLKNLQAYRVSPVPYIFLITYFFDADGFDDCIKVMGDRNGALCYNLTTTRETTIFGKLSELKEKYAQRFNAEQPDDVTLIIDSYPNKALQMPYCW
jgi:16S rRNA (cytidine1402-2'-O)-methyltransferase